MTAIEDIITEVLPAFFADLVRTRWYGREREAISLFAFRHLLSAVHAGSLLHDPAQIGIEVAVPQVTTTVKKQVCKDLVIWPRPAMTCWDANRRPVQLPLAVLEWKVRRVARTYSELTSASTGDVRWLEQFTRISDAMGFAVALALEPECRLVCHRVWNGRIEEKWLDLTAT